MATTARGQITIVDLNDGRTLNAFLTPSKPTKQIYNTDSKSYNPAWTNVDPMIIKLEVYASGSSTNYAGTSYVTNVKFFINDVELKDGTLAQYGVDITDTNDNVDGIKIKNNMASAFYKIECTATFTDPNTLLASTIKSNITLTREDAAGSAIRLLMNTPSGSVFRTVTGDSSKSIETLTIVSAFMRGSSEDTTQISWEWYKDGTKITADNCGTITGYTTKTLTVKKDDVDNVATFKCIAKDTDSSSATHDQTIEDAVTLYDMTDPYSITIEGATELTQRSQNTSLKAKIVQDTEIAETNSIYSNSQFQWLMFDRTNALVKAWDGSKWVACTDAGTAPMIEGGYNNVTVSYNDVTVRCRIVCVASLSI